MALNVGSAMAQGDCLLNQVRDTPTALFANEIRELAAEEIPAVKRNEAQESGLVCVVPESSDLLFALAIGHRLHQKDKIPSTNSGPS